MIDGDFHRFGYVAARDDRRERLRLVVRQSHLAGELADVFYLGTADQYDHVVGDLHVVLDGMPQHTDWPILLCDGLIDGAGRDDLPTHRGGDRRRGPIAVANPADPK